MLTLWNLSGTHFQVSTLASPLTLGVDGTDINLISFLMAILALTLTFGELTHSFPCLRLGMLVTARKRSLGQGNIFIGVCQEFCSHGGGRAWFLGGVCVFFLGGVVFWGGHAWFFRGVRGFLGGCMLLGVGGHACFRVWGCVGGMRASGCGGGGMHGFFLGDTVNERAVRILLECILVTFCGTVVFHKLVNVT